MKKKGLRSGRDERGEKWEKKFKCGMEIESVE